MPHSAILHSTVDFILPPEGIVQELRRIAQHPYLTARTGHAPESSLPPPVPEDMAPILRLLRRATRVEFTHYLQFRVDISHYLRPAPGKANLDLLQIRREGLLIDLSAAMTDAERSGGPVSRAGVQIAYEGQTLSVTLRVLPLTHPPPPASHYMVLFEEAARPAIRQRPSRLPRWVRSWWGWGMRGRCREAITPPGAGTPEPSPLRDELEATKQYLQALIEQREATNEEHRAGGEEILSANEELQSTNEELETAKEELQSANEELTTVNEELRGRNVELAQAHDDLYNLFRSGHLPVVMLDRDLRIRRVTAMAEQVLHIIPTDVGRPLTHLNLTIPLRAAGPLRPRTPPMGYPRAADVTQGPAPPGYGVPGVRSGA